MGKTLREIDRIPEGELRLWMAYADWERKQAEEQARTR